MPTAESRRRDSFQTHRQIELYRRGPRTDPHAIPLSVEDLEAKARARLSPEAYEWVAGGAGQGDTMRANLAAFEHWRIVPRMLCDILQRDLGVRLFNQHYPWPVLLAPIGVQALMHPDAEAASARAAASLGIPFILSTVSSLPLETVAAAMGEAKRWFQLYWARDPELTVSLVRRAENAGFEALVVTLDTQTLGWRERNLDLGYLPFLQGEGLANYLTDPVFCAGLPGGRSDDRDAVVEHYLKNFSNLAHTWADLAFLRRHCRLPILLKGILHPDDAHRAVDAGMDGIIVSNHGGRQVAGAIASLDALPLVTRAIATRLPVLFDGGIRRGSDVFKALALGATAVLLGRPCMWALAVNGEQGVKEYLQNFLADLDLVFGLSGRGSVSDLSTDDLISDEIRGLHEASPPRFSDGHVGFGR